MLRDQIPLIKLCLAGVQFPGSPVFISKWFCGLKLKRREPIQSLINLIFCVLIFPENDMKNIIKIVQNPLGIVQIAF